MEIIDKEQFDKAPTVKIPEDDPTNVPILSKEEINTIIKRLDQPVDLQKELAAKLKLYIDGRITEELKTKNYLSDFIRRWISEYNELLDRIQKNLYGDKSISLHLHKVSHSNISALMRKYKDEKASKEPAIIEIEAKEEGNQDDKEQHGSQEKEISDIKQNNPRNEGKDPK